MYSGFCVVATPTSLADIVRVHAQQKPAWPVFRFLHDGTTDGRVTTLTFGGLDERARAIAAVLQQHGLTGSRAVLAYPPGIEFIESFFGCLYAGVIAMPVFPPEPGRHIRQMPRFLSVCRDGEPAALLTTGTLLSALQSISPLGQLAPDLIWIATDQAQENGHTWERQAPAADDIALIQYTSGSIADPRGILVSHRNLLNNVACLQEALGLSPASVCVLWVPPSHDMGLIGGISLAPFVGMQTYLMSPQAFLKRPFHWLATLSNTRATLSASPNFGFELAMRRTTDEELAALDLSSLDSLVDSSEPVQARTLERFYERFSRAGLRRTALRPCYGLAENTLLASSSPRNTPPRVLSVSRASLQQDTIRTVQRGAEDAAVELVSSGCPVPGHRAIVVNPASKDRLADGQIGEIWLTGPSVGQAYWKRPGDSRETFAAFTSDGEGPFLRTGDLGFLYEEEIYVTGRQKELIIVRGLNFYPQDIEDVVRECHKDIRPGGVAAFGITAAGEEHVAVAAEVAPTTTDSYDTVMDAIQRAVMQALNVTVYQVTLLVPGTLPKTPSGKIQRLACPRFITSSETMPDVLSSRTIIDWRK